MAGCGRGWARNSLSRLCVRQIRSHSIDAGLKPRKENLRKPHGSLIWPKTGSTIALRILTPGADLWDLRTPGADLARWDPSRGLSLCIAGYFMWRNSPSVTTTVLLRSCVTKVPLKLPSKVSPNFFTVIVQLEPSGPGAGFARVPAE